MWLSKKHCDVCASSSEMCALDKKRRVVYIGMVFKTWDRPPKKLVVMDWICAFPQNSHDKILPPNVIVLGGVAFGRFLGHGSRALINRINALIKWTPESFLPLFLLCEGTRRNWQSAPGRGPFLEADHAGIMIDPTYKIMIVNGYQTTFLLSTCLSPDKSVLIHFRPNCPGL